MTNFGPAISGGNMTSFSPKVGELEILDTTKTTLTIGAKVNVTNPTEYAATVPYIDINISVNDTIVGHATARDVSVVPGPNHNLAIVAIWSPFSQSGKEGTHVGRQLLSQYISGLPPWHSIHHDLSLFLRLQAITQRSPCAHIPSPSPPNLVSAPPSQSSTSQSPHPS